jgi:CDP-diacylglycerol---glycerol-3-phosphate 3-phosphatidyltransferase
MLRVVTLYDLKPRFQALLRPLVRKLADAGVTANQVTLLACAVSIAIGLAIWLTATPALFLLLPVWLFARMALNAVDGMLAREFGQKSDLGAYLNELTDVVADAALYLPFALVAPFAPAWVVIVVLLATLTEMAGALSCSTGTGPRRRRRRAARSCCSIAATSTAGAWRIWSTSWTCPTSTSTPGTRAATAARPASAGTARASAPRCATCRPSSTTSRPAHGIAPEDIAVVAQSVGAVLDFDLGARLRAADPRLVLASPAFKVKLYVPFARRAWR